MQLLIDAVVAAADGVTYDLAARLFETWKPAEFALTLAHAPRAAEIIVILNLFMMSAALIWAKFTARLPRFLSTSVFIGLLSCVATIAWVVIPHTPNFLSVGAHSSLTLSKSTPLKIGRVIFLWLFQIKNEFWSYSPLLQVMICHSGVTIIASCFLFIGSFLPASFTWTALRNATGRL